MIAEAISPGARELLRSEGVGYFDAGGSLFVPTPGAFVFIDRPTAKTKARALGTIFHGRKAQVLIELFNRREQWVSVKELANASDVSTSTTSQTLTELERRDWVQARGSGPAKERRLVEPTAMVDAWVRYLANRKPQPRLRFYVPSGDSGDLERRLARACEESEVAYAITGEAAAQRYAPYLSDVSQVTCRLWAPRYVVGGASLRVIAKLDARPADRGWNLAILQNTSSTNLTQTETVDGLRLATPLQVFLDLQGGAGRASEMAEHLRRERLAV